MKVFFDNIVDGSLAAYHERYDLYLLNYHRTVFFHRRLGISYVVKEAKDLSIRTRSQVIIHAKMDVEGEICRSAIVIKDGIIVGVADSLSGGETGSGEALRVFRIGEEPVGVVVGKDMLFSGADNALAAGAAGIVHLTLDPFDLGYCKAYRAHSFLTGASYFGLFSDCAVFVDGKTHIFEKKGMMEIEFRKNERPFERKFLNVSFD